MVIQPMARVSLPSVVVVHYVDPVCPWGLGVERVVDELKGIYRDRLGVEYRVCVAVDDIDQWMQRYGFDSKSIVDFHKKISSLMGVSFDPEFIFKIGLNTSRPACRALKAAQRQDELKASKYFRRMLKAFLIDVRPYNHDNIFAIAREAGLDDQKLSRDVNSKSVEEELNKDMEEREKIGASFQDIVISTAEGRSERVSGIFQVDSIVEIIDRLLPGLHKYTQGARLGVGQ